MGSAGSMTLMTTMGGTPARIEVVSPASHARVSRLSLIERERDERLIAARGRRLSAILYLKQHGCR